MKSRWERLIYRLLLLLAGVLIILYRKAIKMEKSRSKVLGRKILALNDEIYEMQMEINSYN